MAGCSCSSSNNNDNKAVTEMNLKGIFTPGQISDSVQKFWDEAPKSKDGQFVDKVTCQKIVHDTIDSINSKVWDDNEYQKQYKKFDPLGQGQIIQPIVIAITTVMINTGKLTPE